MALIDFTTFEDVRAVLGVSVDELEDATLGLSVYEFDLKDELSEVSEDAIPGSDLIADYSSAKAKAPADRTADEQRLIEYTRLFSTYAVARHLTAALPLFSPKEQTDGKASIVRYTQDPYKHTVSEIKARYERYRDRLIKAYSAAMSSAAPATVLRTYLSGSQPTSDPVTGA